MSYEDYRYLAEHGKCAEEGLDFTVFFPEYVGGTQMRKLEAAAKAVCNECAVVNKCFQVAIDNKETGIWGGTTHDERLRFTSRGKYKSLNLKTAALETANHNRAVQAGKNHADKLVNALVLLGDTLSPDTLELAQARIAHPELSLDQVGMLVTPVLTKYQVRSRLRTVLQHAEKLQ